MCIALKLTLFDLSPELFYLKKKKSTVRLALISTEPKLLQSLVSTKFSSKTLDNYIPTSFMEKKNYLNGAGWRRILPTGGKGRSILTKRELS